MTRYRKVDVRLWGDQKFRALSKPNPNAQHLWLYLLTGPHTTNLPGLFQIGIGSIAEKLRWPYVDTEKCFQELIDLEMIRYDSEAFVVWIPNHILYNLPANHNVILGWRIPWDIIPDSPLKIEFLNHSKLIINQYKENITSSFNRAFEGVYHEADHRMFFDSSSLEMKPFAKPLPKPFRERLPIPLPEGYGKPGTGTGAGIKKKITKKKFIKKNSRQKLSKQVPTESLLEASWPIDSTLLDMTSMLAPTTEKVEVPDGVC